MPMWKQILFRVPQGSVLGPILLNIFFSDSFLILNDINIAIFLPMTIPFIKYVTTLMLLSKVWKCQSKSYSGGLNRIKWKVTHISAIWYYWLRAASVKNLSVLTLIINNIFDWYAVVKPLRMKKYLKWMDKSLFIIKTFKDL